jgi:hypothetical protein
VVDFNLSHFFAHINTGPGEKTFKNGFAPWNPTQVLAFYSGRFLEYPVKR